MYIQIIYEQETNKVGIVIYYSIKMEII